MDPSGTVNYFYLFLTGLLVLFNGFFTAAEFALVRVRGSQIELKIKTGSRVARITRSIMNNLDGYIAATQLGITIAALGLGVVGEGVFTDIMLAMFKSFGVIITSQFIITLSRVLAFVVITFLSIVFGELAPKNIAIQRSVRTALAVSTPLRIFFIVFRPIIWVLNKFAGIILKMLGIKPGGGGARRGAGGRRRRGGRGRGTGAGGAAGQELI